MNFVRSNYDYCLYVNNTGKDSIYILVFVDDLLICCKDKNKINKVKASLIERFTMNDLGEIDKHIGIDIEYSEDRGKMTLSQTKYRRVGGKRSYFEKALKKELFRMSVEKGAISNES